MRMRFLMEKNLKVTILYTICSNNRKLIRDNTANCQLNRNVHMNVRMNKKDGSSFTHTVPVCILIRQFRVFGRQE